MEKKNLGYCGIDCRGFCIMGTGKLSEQALDLQKNLEMFELEHWKDEVPVPEKERFNFKELLKGLEWIQKYTRCPGCRAGGGPPECKIRKCAKSKGLEGCWECGSRKTCENLEPIMKGHPEIAR